MSANCGHQHGLNVRLIAITSPFSAEVKTAQKGGRQQVSLLSLHREHGSRVGCSSEPELALILNELEEGLRY